LQLSHPAIRIDKSFQDQHSDAPLPINGSFKLGDIASAKKRARQNEKRRQHNISHRSLLRSSIKKVLTAVQSKDKAAATEASKTAVPVIDRMARKGFIHKNKAARHKLQISAMLKGLGTRG